MRFLGIGEWNDLGDLYLHLRRDGHLVRVYIADPGAHDILDGLVERVDDWRDHLEWIREAGPEGVIVFETVDHGQLQDDLRAAGYQVIGGTAFGDRLETDRAFGQQVMRDAGLEVLPSWSFSDAASACTFIAENPSRYVMKCDTGSAVVCSTHVGRAVDGADIAALLRMHLNRQSTGRILLTLYAAGVEVGVGAYFNGQRFLAPACLDWEHKRFFPGDIGELTGEMGTLVTYNGAENLFGRTLARFASQLHLAGHVGYINLNLIVNRTHIWPLEFTCRFGYPGYAILGTLQVKGWADLFKRILDPGARNFTVSSDYALGVVITVPPFPYPDGYERLSKGLPISFSDARPDDAEHFHLAEAALNSGGLVCAGQIGYPLVVTGTGKDAEAAKSDAYARVERVIIPDMRFRNDIGDSFIIRDRKLLREWGYLGSDP